MGRFIFKIKPYQKELYNEWSTIVDSPLGSFMPFETFKKHYKYKYGNESMHEFDKRMQRVKKTGCSGHGYSIERLLRWNRAGKNGGHVKTDKGLYRIYGYLE